MKLRYYGDSSTEADHRAVVDRLADVHREWGVPVEIVRLHERHVVGEFPGPVRTADADAVYDRDFADNDVLAANVGQPPAEAFCAGNGLPTIAGSVGIIESNDEGVLLWATLLSGEPPGTELFDPDAYSVGFLDEVLADGPDVLEEKCAAVAGAEVTPPGRLAGDADLPADVIADQPDVEDGPSRPGGDAGAPRHTHWSGPDANAAGDPASVDLAAGNGPAGSRSGGRTDEDLVAEFVADAAVMDGVDQTDVRWRVTLGDMPASVRDLSRDARSLSREFGTRTVDAVVEGDRRWLVETRSHLSARELDAGLGRVLVADALYRTTADVPEDETVPTVVFDGAHRDLDEVSEADDLLSFAVDYAAVLGVELFVRDPSLDEGLFRRLTDYGSTPASVSMDSRAV